MCSYRDFLRACMRNTAEHERSREWPWLAGVVVHLPHFHSTLLLHFTPAGVFYTFTWQVIIKVFIICVCVCVCVCVHVQFCVRVFLPCFVWRCLIIFICSVCLYTTDLYNYGYLCIVCFSLSCKVLWDFESTLISSLLLFIQHKIWSGHYCKNNHTHTHTQTHAHANILPIHNFIYSQLKQITNGTWGWGR